MVKPSIPRSRNPHPLHQRTALALPRRVKVGQKECSGLWAVTSVVLLIERKVLTDPQFILDAVAQAATRCTESILHAATAKNATVRNRRVAAPPMAAIDRLVPRG